MKQIKHIGRQSVYSIAATGRLQTSKPLEDMTELCAYFGEDGQIWYRTPEEINDGRFEILPDNKDPSIQLKAIANINDENEIKFEPGAQTIPGEILVYEKDAQNTIKMLFGLVEMQHKTITSQLAEIDRLKK